MWYSYPPPPSFPVVMEQSPSPPPSPVVVKEKKDVMLQVPENNNQQQTFITKEEIHYVNDDIFSPVLFVLDFDHTLAVYDSKHLLRVNLRDSSPSIYTRPFLYEFLNYLTQVNTHNKLILWTAGSNSYIQHALTLCNITHYFHHILTKSDCKESKRKYGPSKAYAYIVDKFPQYSSLRSVLIDDKAMHNSSRGKKQQLTYTTIYSVKPYTVRTVGLNYGAYNVDASLIGDIDIFLRTKGLAGRDNNNNIKDDDGNIFSRVYRPIYGDTVLLVLIERLEREIFGNSGWTETEENNNNNDKWYYITTTNISDNKKSKYIPLTWLEITS